MVSMVYLVVKMLLSLPEILVLMVLVIDSELGMSEFLVLGR